MAAATNIRDTSIEAYRRASITPRQAEILHFIRGAIRNTGAADFTRGELSHYASIPINCVCPRVLELIEAGVLMEMPRRKCRFSGRAAYPVALVPVQRSLL
jgi:hypothetical protein